MTIDNRSLKIGSLALKTNLMMAPMAGITDLPFRALAKEGGAGLTFTEMISARALVRGDKKTEKMMRPGEAEHPVGIQLFGSDPNYMAEAARIAEAGGADLIDINMGCPVRKVMKAGAGVKLLENEAGLGRMMGTVAQAVKIPVSIKTRIGRTPGENIAPSVARIAEQSGIKMVIIHGRPASQGHSGDADREAVRQVVQSVTIPVVGNGGVKDERSAKLWVDETGCAGLMIGRAAIGDPYIFDRITHFLATGDLLSSPTWEERLAFLKRHAELAVAYYSNEKKGIIILRKLAAFYMKGLPNASRIRNAFNAITTLKELDELLATVWESPYFGEGKEIE
jgi:tRNA-dihydrouridine synthase B